MLVRLNMFFILILCPVLMIEGVQTLTIDSHLGTSVEDCFERISIGEQLPDSAIYRNVTELTSRECEHICKQDKQCQVYDYGVGAKGNATCNLSQLDEKEVQTKNLLLRHPDYDVYVRRVLCEQGPPKPIQVLADEPIEQGPQHKPVFRPDPEDRPLTQDYVITSDIAFKPRPPIRPDDTTGLADFPPSYGDHKPQDIPYKPSRPNDKFRPNDYRPNNRPRPEHSYQANPPDPSDELHFQGYEKPRPEPLNDEYFKPENAQYQFFRPNRRPQGEDYYKPSYDQGHLNGPTGPNNRPQRPQDNYSYNNNYAGNYGLNPQNDNSVYVEIYDPPRPYIPIKDRPHQNNYAQGYLGYGTYSDHNRPNRPAYGQTNDDPGYSTQKPINGHNPNDFADQSYGNKPNDFGYGLHQGQHDQSSYNDHGTSEYGYRPDDSYGYRPQKPNRPYGVQDTYGSEPQSFYGSNSYNSYNNPNHLTYDEYNSNGIYNIYGQGSYGQIGHYGQNDNTGYKPNRRPGYGNDEPFAKPQYGSKPDSDYQKPSYGHIDRPSYGYKPSYDEKPSYGSQKPTYSNPTVGYGQTSDHSQKPGYGTQKPKPGYNDQTGYGGQKPSYNDPKPGYNDQTVYGGSQKPIYNDPKPGYNDQTGYGGQKPSYNDPKPGYNDQTGYGGQKPSYNDPKPGYNDETGYGGSQKPIYNDAKPGYSGQTGYGGSQTSSFNDQTGYGGQKPSYNNPKPGYNDPKPGYDDQTGYGNQRPVYNDPKPGYGNQKPGYNDPKPGYGSQKPGYNDPKPSYGNQKPGYNDQIDRPIVNYSDPDRPDIKPVYEYDVEKPVKVPSYISKPGGAVVTSYPVVIHDYGEKPLYKEPGKRASYLACFRRVLAGKRTLRSFVRKVAPCETLEDCRRECATEKRFNCESFNYRQSPSYRGKGLCELMTRPIEAFDLRRDFVEDRNYDFYEVDRNSLEPNCPETLGGPGLLHSGFLSSKPGRGEVDRGWISKGELDRGWDRRWDRGNPGHRNIGHQMFVPYQIGVVNPLARSDDQESWGRYGGFYGGNYYKDKHDYDKSISHWGLSIDNSAPYFKDFDYNNLGKHFADMYPKGRKDFRKYLGYEVQNIQEKIGRGSGSWKRGRWNSSGNVVLEEEPRTIDSVERNEVDDHKGECYSLRRPGMSLSMGSIKRSLRVSGVTDCEAACFNELDFKCVSYSFRYSHSRNSDNCFLSERAYRGVELSVDSGSDVYGMPQIGCMTNRPWVESECFWHVRSDTAVSGVAVSATLTVSGLGACEAECIRAEGFFCRVFSFRFSPPTIGDDDLNNCILTSYPPTRLEGNSRIAPGHELYARGNYGRGCEPATYDDTKESGECYLQYDKAAKLSPSATHAKVHVKTEQECGNACTEAPFKCLTFSFNNNAPPHTENCYLSEIRLFDLQRGVDYVHSKDDWLFSFDVFSASCWHKRHHHEKSSEIPHPILTTPDDVTYPGTVPSAPSGPSGPSYSSETPTLPSGPSGPDYSFETTGPEKPFSIKPTGPHLPTTSFSKETYPDHSLELPRPIQTIRPTGPEIKPTIEIRPHRPDSQEYPGSFRPDASDRPYSPSDRPYRPADRPYRPSDRPGDYYPGGQRPNDPVSTGYGKPPIHESSSFGDRPPFRPPGPTLKPGPTYYPSVAPRPVNKPNYIDGPNRADYFGKYPNNDKDIHSMQVSWSQYTVSGFPCRAGTKCAQNHISGHWACETEGGEIGSWDYCCAPSHRCGYSEGFQKPWCYVGSKEDQWRPCSEKYYPYHQHSTPHPSQGQGGYGGQGGLGGYGPGPAKENQPANRPWRDTYHPNNPAYIPHWDKRRGPYLSEADRKYWDDLYENGPKAYYDKHGNPLPGYTRVPTEQRPHIKYNSNRGPEGHWVPVGHGVPVGHEVSVGHEDDLQVPGLGSPRYWPVAYLHKSPPPNTTYFRFNETRPTTERIKPITQNSIPEARNIDTRNIDTTLETIAKDNKTSIFDVKPQINNKTEKTNRTVILNTPVEVTTKQNLIKNDTKEKPLETDIASVEDFEEPKTVFDTIKGIDDKLGDFSKSIEVLNIEDVKNSKASDSKTLEAEERQIEALGRLLASRRDGKLILGRTSELGYQDEKISVDDDVNFSKKYPERRGTVKRISKTEIEREKEAEKSLEVSETTYVRPPRVLSTTERVKQTVVNGKVFFDASLREERISNSTRGNKKSRKLRSSYINTTTPSNVNYFGKKKVRILSFHPNPIKRVKRVYRKRYNPDEVRKRLLKRERNVRNMTGL